MNVVKLYRKTLSFFSRTRQEEIISSIEKEFYEIISAYAQEKTSPMQVQIQLEKICAKIHHHAMHYYFEDDLLDHLFNLMTLITNYSQEVNTTYTNKTASSSAVKVRARK